MATIRVMIMAQYANKDPMVLCTHYCKFAGLCPRIGCLCPPPPDKFNTYLYVRGFTIVDVKYGGYTQGND